MCDHYSFSAQCLLAGLRKLRRITLVCDGHHVERDRTFYGHAPRRPSLAFISGQTIALDQRIGIMKIEQGTKTTHTALLQALREKDIFICPHLRTSSPALFEGKKLAASNFDGDYWSYWDIPQPPPARECCDMTHDFGARSGDCIVWSDCSDKYCRTRYGLRREEGYYENRFMAVLEIGRDLVGGPTDPSWLAQLSHGDGKAMGGGRSVASCGRCSPRCCVNDFPSPIVEA